MSVTSAVSADSTSFTETRIHNPRTLGLVRLVCAVFPANGLIFDGIFARALT
jgi:hypothetical protein